jgi:hypothetical protein
LIFLEEANDKMARKGSSIVVEECILEINVKYGVRSEFVFFSCGKGEEGCERDSCEAGRLLF